MNSKVCTTVLIAASLFLSACGGGGGSSSGGPPPTPSYTACPNGYTGTAPNCVAAQTTTAWGVVVDDPSGNPLAGVTVRLEPWTTYPTPGPSPTPIATTTTDPTGHFSIGAANGHYLLVIGSDDANDGTRPTIHDNVMLNGGTQTLIAPTMPPVPGITPPPTETDGSYRLATIDQTHEMPCITAYDQARASAQLSKPVIDEWLTENVRVAVEQSVTPYAGQTDPRNPYGFITSGGITVSGGSSCANAMTTLNQAPNQMYFDGSTWYAGSYYAYQQGSQIPAYGHIEFPIDPRLYKDPYVLNWP